MSFDPTAIQPIQGIGRVYPTIQIADAWGTLTVSGGALINSDFNALYVEAPMNPKARPLKEKSWELRLNDGWKLEPGEQGRLSGSQDSQINRVHGNRLLPS